MSPRYLERATEQFANNYFPELSATHYVATAAANAPFDELKKCCLFQLADEQRHLEMDRDVFERAGIPERDWLPAWEQPGTTCRFFRHVLELEDSIEILVKANFVAEGAAGPATFAVLADGAEARGDLLSAVNHRARVRDETRHISYARALVRALIEEDAANLDVIQRWQDESLAPLRRGGPGRATPRVVGGISSTRTTRSPSPGPAPDADHLLTNLPVGGRAWPVCFRPVPAPVFAGRRSVKTPERALLGISPDIVADQDGDDLAPVASGSVSRRIRARQRRVNGDDLSPAFEMSHHGDDSARR